MGAIAAVVHWDGRPFQPGEVAASLAASPHRAPHGTGVVTVDGASLGQQRFLTTREQDFDAQPLIDRVRATAFVFDGRLDNRAELISALGLPRGADLADATIALQACLRWGRDAPRRLLGDFAFIAWNWRERRLLAARDHMGVRHLHFASPPRALVCATDVAQVLSHPSVAREPDAAVAADYLSCDVQNGPSTLFGGISRVPPGHLLTATADGVCLERYWSPEPRTALRYASDAAYAEHCRELLTAAVDARLRTRQRAAAMLSGGLDSSSVVTAAHLLLVHRHDPPQPFSLVFPDHPETDERPFIGAVARRCGVDPIMVRPAAVSAEVLDGQAHAWLNVPAFPSDAAARSLYDEMVARGHSVALTGAAGDFLFSGSVFQYADLLRSWQPRAAVRRFLNDRRAEDTGVTPLGLLQAGVWPLLPRVLKRTLRPIARRVAGVSDSPPWVRLRRQSAEAYPDRPRGGSFATEEVTRLLASGMQSHFIECGDRAAAEAGIELRHPFLDARLVQFALDIPDDQRRRGPYPKYVLRRALDAELPDEVRLRRTKAGFGHCVVEALDALGGERFFANLTIANAGWVEGELLARRFAGMRRAYAAGDQTYGRDIPGLWMCAAVELWFRSAFDRGEVSCAAIPRRRA